MGRLRQETGIMALAVNNAQACLEEIQARCRRGIDGVDPDVLDGWHRDYSMGYVHALQEIADAVTAAINSHILTSHYGAEAPSE